MESSPFHPTTNSPEIPFWWRAAPLEADTGDVPPENCDVVIVGSGYTGLSAALYLSKGGCNVVVLDRDAPGYGASSRNGGIASGNLRIGINQARERFGDDKARKLFQESVAARTHLRSLIEDYNIECDYQLNGRFTGALTVKDLEHMTRDVERFSKFTGVEAYAVGRTDLPQYIGSDLYIGGIVRTDIAHFHPGKLHHGLLKAARDAGAQVIGHCAVDKIIPKTRPETATEAGHFTVQTTRGKITTQEIIMATNGYINNPGANNKIVLDSWLNKRIVPVKSRIVVTEKLSKNLVATLMPNLRAMGENRNLYRYFRPGPEGDRIMFGSREPITGGTTSKAVEHVRRGMVDVFPELDKVQVDSSWAGLVAFSRSELPLLFKHEGIHYAAGYCGSGTVWAPWFGKVLAEKILAATNGEAPSASMFFCDPPSSLPLYNGKPWFLPAAMLLEGLKDRMQGRT